MKNCSFILTLIVFFALTPRAVRIVQDKYFDKDAVIYISMAEKIADGDFEAAYAILPRTPPLYIWLIALSKRLAGISFETAGRLISLISGTMLVLPVFLIGKRLAGEKVGLIAAFLVASHPYLIRDSADVMRDSLFFLLFFSCVAIAIEASLSNGFSRLWYLAGVMAGLSVLTRSEGNELVLGFAAWLSYETYFAVKEKGLKTAVSKILPTVLAGIAGFMLVVVPAHALLQKSGSDWTFGDTRIIGYIDSFISYYDAQKEGAR